MLIPLCKLPQNVCEAVFIVFHETWKLWKWKSISRIFLFKKDFSIEFGFMLNINFIANDVCKTSKEIIVSVIAMSKQKVFSLVKSIYIFLAQLTWYEAVLVHKACVCYFLSNFLFFHRMITLQKLKNVFYFI